MICILNCEELVGRQQRARFMGVTTLLWMLRGPKEASKIYGDVQAAWGNGGKTCVRIQLFTTMNAGFKTYMYIVSTMKKRTIAIWWRKPNNDDDDDDDDDDDEHTMMTTTMRMMMMMMMMMMMLILFIIQSDGKFWCTSKLCTYICDIAWYANDTCNQKRWYIHRILLKMVFN